MSLSQRALAQATAFRSGARKSDADRLKDVVKELTAALAPSLWIDGNHVDSRHGDQVFEKHQDAVETLKDLLRHGSLADSALQGSSTRSCTPTACSPRWPSLTRSQQAGTGATSRTRRDSSRERPVTSPGAASTRPSATTRTHGRARSIRCRSSAAEGSPGHAKSVIAAPP
jgi:hypothetical protein